MGTTLTLGNNPIMDIMINLRRVRFLYQKALKCVGPSTSSSRGGGGGSNQKDTTTTTNHYHDALDYETSLRCLCHEYTLFEKYFGSHRSYTECLKVTNKKLVKIASSIVSSSSSITVSSIPSSFPAVAAIVQDQAKDQNQVTSVAFHASTSPIAIASATTPAPTPAIVKNTGAADAHADADAVILVTTTGSQDNK